jgi:hypothetical protein
MHQDSGGKGRIPRQSLQEWHLSDAELFKFCMKHWVLHVWWQDLDHGKDCLPYVVVWWDGGAGSMWHQLYLIRACWVCGSWEHYRYLVFLCPYKSRLLDSNWDRRLLNQFLCLSTSLTDNDYLLNYFRWILNAWIYTSITSKCSRVRSWKVFMEEKTILGPINKYCIDWTAVFKCSQIWASNIRLIYDKGVKDKVPFTSMATKHRRLEFQENNKGFHAITSTIYCSHDVQHTASLNCICIIYSYLTH